MRVFEKGLFYCEQTDRELTEKELIDCEVCYVITDRSGRVGVVTRGCYEDSIHWIEDDDKKYRVET